MAFTKLQENQFRIDEEIAENHAILVNLTASIVKLTCERVNPLSAGTVFRHQNLRSRVEPHTE